MAIEDNRFVEQARLMLQSLPYILEEDLFALKGGSAINFFFRDMPRLSVDIDLAYLPIEQREQSLGNIETALQRIAKKLKENLSEISIQESKIKNPKMINGAFLRPRKQIILF